MAQRPRQFTMETLERKKLEKLRSCEKDARLHKRLSALLWLNKGYSFEEVAELLDVCPRTVKNWVAFYQAGGVERLCSLDYQGDPGTLSRAQLDQLKQEVATGRFKCAAQVCEWVETAFGRRFSASGMRKLLKRVGCSFHKASAFLFKADQDKQKEFVAEYEQDKQKVQQAGWRRYFLDGVHPLWGLEVIFYCWLLAGQRLEVGVGGGRKRLNILGAYCPDDQEYLDRRYTDKNLNAQSVIELFTLMMVKHPETKHFRIYLDNARYQHACLLKEWIAQTKKEKGVTFDLKHLPAYSPNLNLIERLWKFLRKEALQRWHPTFEDMQKAVADVLDNLPNYRERLQTLMTERFHLTPLPSTIIVGVGQPAKQSA
jgi:transposase